MVIYIRCYLNEVALASAYSVKKALEWLVEVCRHHRYAACSSRTRKAKVNLEQMLSSCPALLILEQLRLE